MSPVVPIDLDLHESEEELECLSCGETSDLSELSEADVERPVPLPYGMVCPDCRKEFGESIIH
jgi:hypothetical protein